MANATKAHKQDVAGEISFRALIIYIWGGGVIIILVFYIYIPVSLSLVIIL